MTNIKLASGRGQYHTDKTKPLESITFAQIEQMLEQPQQCDKSEAKWFIPCNVLTRSKDKQNALNALFYCLWADLDDMQGETLQTLADYACNELLPLGLGSVKVLAYNTKSASNENQKSRLILPTAKPLGIDDFIRCQTVLNG